jgi:hypothetical protein
MRSVSEEWNSEVSENELSGTEGDADEIATLASTLGVGIVLPSVDSDRWCVSGLSGPGTNPRRCIGVSWRVEKSPSPERINTSRMAIRRANDFIGEPEACGR